MTLLQNSVLALFALIATPASAQVTAIAGGNPDHIDIALPVTASIGAHCGFAAAPNGTYSTPDLHQAFTHDFPFALQCTGPSRVAIVSANGGLLAAVGAPPSGYTRLAPYRVTLSLAGDSGVTSESATCDAQNLAADAVSPCLFRGPAAGGQGLLLSGPSSNVSGSYLRVNAPAYGGGAILVAANNYQDTLTITLSAAQ